MRMACRTLVWALGCVVLVQGDPSLAEDTRDARRLEREARRAQMIERRSMAREERNSRSQDLRNKRDDRNALCARIGSYLAGIPKLPAAARNSRQGGLSTNGVPYESWLLQDAFFVPAFGSRFDALGADEAQRFKAAGTNCKAPAGEDGQKISDPMLFYRAFHAPYADRYKRGVAEIRSRNAEADRMIDSLKSLARDASAVSRFEEISARRQTTGAFLLPQASAELDQAFKDAYRRIVVPVRTEQLEAAARGAHGIAGLRSLAALRNDVQRASSSAGVAVGLPAGFVQRYDALVAEVGAAERRRVDSFGGGLEGLERGAVWKREFDQSIGNIDRSLPAVGDYFLQKRSEIIGRARPQLLAGISASKSEAELNDFLLRYIPLPDDQQGAVGLPIASAVQAQRARLSKAAVLARNDGAAGVESITAPRSPPPVERRSSSTSASSGGEPTEDQMYDAYKGRVDNINAQLASTMEQCNRREYKAGGGDPVLALQCLSVGIGAGLKDGGRSFNTPSFSISRFKKIACEKAAGRAGYHCDFVAGVETTMQNVPRSFARMLSDGEIRQGRFVQQSSSWMMLEE